MKVLVVENNLVMMEIISDVLRIDGFEVIAANNCELGDSLYSNQVPEIVVYDADIPGGSIANFSNKAKTVGGTRIVAICSNNESVPDNPIIVSRIIKPFKGSEVLVATRKAKGDLEVKKTTFKKITSILGGIVKTKKTETASSVAQATTPQGKSFIVFESAPDKIYDIGKNYLVSDSKLLVLTTSSIKSVKNRYGGMDIVVKGLSKKAHDDYISFSKIGTIMSTMGNFASNNANSTIILEGIDELIAVHGSNTVITMLCQLVENGKKTKTTFLLSVKPGVLEDKDLQLLTHYMNVYSDSK